MVKAHKPDPHNLVEKWTRISYKIIYFLLDEPDKALKTNTFFDLFLTFFDSVCLHIFSDIPVDSQLWGVELLECNVNEQPLLTHILVVEHISRQNLCLDKKLNLMNTTVVGFFSDNVFHLSEMDVSTDIPLSNDIPPHSVHP